MNRADPAVRFEQLYRENFDRVAAYLLARADRDTAGEAVARTFEIAWRRLEDVPEQPLPWLLGVARKVLADGWRSQRRRHALTERIALLTPALTNDHAEAHMRRQQLLDAISALPASQREVLLLIAWEGLSERQAATVLGCSRGAVALRLHRARRSLRAALHRGATRATDPPAAVTLRASTKEAT